MRLFAHFILLLLALVLQADGLFAAEVIPPKPPRHFNDFARVTSPEVQQRLDRALADLEKTDSTQIVVAIYPRMQSDADIAEYTVRVAEKWGAGTREKDNGAVLFVFVEDRKMFLQVGYGLEGALPDITAKDITENRIKPHFRSGNYDAGMIAGVEAIIQAVRGEYQGTGRTTAPRRGGKWVTWVVVGLFLFAFIAGRMQNRGYVYGGRRRQRGWGPIIFTGGPSWGGGGWSSGRGGGGWGGGFSGGGGSFGGGGAGSSW